MADVLNILDIPPSGGATSFLGLTDTPGTYAGSALLGVRVNAGATALEFAAAGGALPYVLLQDQKASGTDGGTFTSGAWRTRDLNTIVTDTGGNVVSLIANVFILAAGTYRILAFAPAHKSPHICRLRNTTAGTTLLLGTSSWVSGGGGAGEPAVSVIDGRFTVAAAQSLELQDQTTLTRATDGFGVAIGIAGIGEKYATIELLKE